ncbi:nuclear apoptosis-inducing factor 1-like [Pleurodeles waltl]|uniref:nuclear apoptosis-inducing factor 1-like n=1 Tax=Pleurodeles waltl TaxID=8319 RepID=UPI0037093FDA
MPSQDKEAPSAGRNRNLMFSEKDLEVLTEECCLHHDVLFGKAAMSVPDSQKKKIWQDILTKINAIRVSHRTLDEVCKRWYDLRSSTKERVAVRMREIHGTGGGPSTVPPPTAIETMVETTLEPKAVLGIGDLDSSAPGTSKSLPQGPTNSATVQGEEQAIHTQEEAATETAGECMTTPPVQHAPEDMDDPDLGLEAANMTPWPMMRVDHIGQLALCVDGNAQFSQRVRRMSPTNNCSDRRHPYCKVTSCKTDTCG